MDKAQKFENVSEEAQKYVHFNCDNLEKQWDISKKPTTISSFGEAFKDQRSRVGKAKEGSWEYQGCYSRNDPSVVKYLSCKTNPDQDQALVIAPSSNANSSFSGGFESDPKNSHSSCSVLLFE